MDIVQHSRQSLTIFVWTRVQCGRVRERESKEWEIIYDAFNSFLFSLFLPSSFYMRHKRIFPLSFCLLLRNSDFGRREEKDFKIYCRLYVRETWNCFYLKRLSDIREHHQRLNCFSLASSSWLIQDGGGIFFLDSIISLSFDILWSWK